MKILEHGPYKLNNTAVCLGKFDGLHSGHRLLLDSVRESTDLTKVLFTFRFTDSRHIYSSEEKRYLAEKLGIQVYIYNPDIFSNNNEASYTLYTSYFEASKVCPPKVSVPSL